MSSSGPRKDVGTRDLWQFSWRKWINCLFTLIAVVVVSFLFMLNRSINVIDQRSREKQATGEGEKDGAQLLKIQENGVHVMTPRGVSHLN